MCVCQRAEGGRLEMVGGAGGEGALSPLQAAPDLHHAAPLLLATEVSQSVLPAVPHYTTACHTYKMTAFIRVQNMSCIQILAYGTFSKRHFVYWHVWNIRNTMYFL